MGALWQTDSHQAEADSPSPAPLPKKFRPPRPWRRLFWLILLLVLAIKPSGLFGKAAIKKV